MGAAGTDHHRPYHIKDAASVGHRNSGYWERLAPAKFKKLYAGKTEIEMFSVEMVRLALDLVGNRSIAKVKLRWSSP
jgi:hypothetical protein